MTTAEKHIALSLFAGMLLTSPAFSQPNAVQPQFVKPSATPGPAKGVPLTHLYYHFLLLQNYLDTKAASLDAQGQNGNFVRADLQKKMGFSDTDYAPIHDSAGRFASELGQLETQVKAINETVRAERKMEGVSFGTPPPPNDELKTLRLQRDADLDAEIASLTQNLSAKNKEKLEQFLVVFFAPKNLSVHIPAAAGQAASSTEVQK